MEFNKNCWYQCLHDYIIKNECAFTKGHIYKCDASNILRGNNNESVNLNDINADWDYYFKLLVAFKDNVDHPPHYSWLKDKCGIEVIDITRHLDFDLGNAIKYILRAGRKEDAIEDLKKAIWYLNDKINMLENKK